MNKIKKVWFYSLYRNYFFLSKTQWSLTCGDVLLFSELHDVKTERNMSCKMTTEFPTFLRHDNIIFYTCTKLMKSDRFFYRLIINILSEYADR